MLKIIHFPLGGGEVVGKSGEMLKLSMDLLEQVREAAIHEALRIDTKGYRLSPPSALYV
jgi:hypothetical protein